MKIETNTNFMRLSTREIKQYLAGTKIKKVKNAILDIDRVRRKGFPEVVLAEGKEVPDIIQILKVLAKEGHPAIASRVSAKQAKKLIKEFSSNCLWHPQSKVFVANKNAIPKLPYPTTIGILTAGLSDRPCAEEICQLLKATHYPVVKICDVGVSGLQRLLLQIKDISHCEVVIVVAGMEGALPTVVAGLLEQPVIAVPTSVGYGVSRNGTTALQTMLASCSPGMSVVNIDNGYGAAMMAHAICLRIHKGKRSKITHE